MTTIERFLSRLHGRTRENYAYCLSQWAAWLGQRGVSIECASRQDIEEWIAWRMNTGISARTICTDVSHLRGLYWWMVEDGIRPDDPTMLVRRPKYGRTTRPYLSVAQTRRLLEGSVRWSDGELAAQVHLWALSGLRPGEPRALSVSDVIFSVERSIVRVRATKTRSYEALTLPSSTAAVLSQAAHHGHGPLLLNPRTGARWSKTTEAKRFARLLHDLELPHVTPYALRVGFITHSLAAGIDERLVMISARHTSSAQTSRYDRLRDQIERAVGPQLEQWLHEQK